MEHFITKVAEVADVSELGKEETISVLSESGLSMTLTNDNKMRVIQSLIVHDAIGKPKILLDQLREKFQTLGFRSRMQVYPELFKELFVAGEKEMKGSDIKEILMFPSEMSDAEKTIMEQMTEFIVGATPDILKAFLTFATGAPCLPEFGLGRIRIEFEDAGSIFILYLHKDCNLAKKFP